MESVQTSHRIALKLQFVLVQLLIVNLAASESVLSSILIKPV